MEMTEKGWRRAVRKQAARLQAEGKPLCWDPIWGTLRVAAGRFLSGRMRQPDPEGVDRTVGERCEVEIGALWERSPGAPLFRGIPRP